MRRQEMMPATQVLSEILYSIFSTFAASGHFGFMSGRINK
jgi:hypothetical protein